MVPKGVFIKNHAVIFKDGKKEKLFNLKDIKLVGEHNISNVLAAALTAKLAGVPNKYISRGIKTYPGLHSRLELIKEKGGIKFYNDTTATTPDATTAALKAFTTRRVVLIAGGKNKNLKYRDLAQVIKQRVKELILLPGTATDLLVKQLPISFKVNLVDNMQRAVKLAVKYSGPGDYVILSPGAASFGLFVNEWDRGKQFVNVVKKL